MEIVETYKEECDCGEFKKHFNGGNYHNVAKVLRYEENYYLLRTTTRERFGNENAIIVPKEEGLVLLRGQRAKSMHENLLENDLVDKYILVNSEDRLERMESKERALSAARSYTNKVPAGA